MQTEFTYELRQGFEYASKGELAQAAFITLKAPTSKNITECAHLKQSFFRAIPKDRPEVEAQEEAAGITGDDIMTLIMMSPEVDLAVVLLTARELFSSGVALVDGETKVTKPIIDVMSQADLETMTGEYLANFILASVLQKMNQS